MTTGRQDCHTGMQWPSAKPASSNTPFTLNVKLTLKLSEGLLYYCADTKLGGTMGVPLLNINFYGHDDAASSGTRSYAYSGGDRTSPFHRWGFLSPPRDEISGLTRNYNAVLGHGNFVGQAACIVDAAIADYRAICSQSVVNVMITGYSSGGLTALCAARAVNGLPDANLLYVGLADAAIDTTDPVQVSFAQSPSITAGYLKNYYQTLGNQDSNPSLTPNMTPPEWHGVFPGFVSISLNGESAVIAASTAKDDDPHEHACRIAISRIKDDLKWCDAQYGAPILDLPTPTYG